MDAIKELKNYEVNVDQALEKYILDKIEERSQAKKEKDFAKADAIREELLEKGIQLLMNVYDEAHSLARAIKESNEFKSSCANSVESSSGRP